MYWITSNLVTLVQNYLIYNHGPGKRDSTPDAAGKLAKFKPASPGKNRVEEFQDQRLNAYGSNGREQDQNGLEGDAAVQASKVNKRKRRKKKKR